MAQLLLQQKTGRHKALIFTQISKTLVTHKTVPHSLSECTTHPGLASLELCTAGASTAAIPTEDWRAQCPHLHADDQDVGCTQECASQFESAQGWPELQCSLQELAQLLYQLKGGGHKVLIFTQMTKTLIMYKSVPHSLSECTT